MYLKINYLGQTKKIMLKDDLRQEDAFFELLGRLTKLPRSDLLVTFTDLENETVAIVDQFDLDYFLTDAGKTNFLTVNVQSISNFGQELPRAGIDLTESGISMDFPTQLPPAKPTAEMNIQTEGVKTNEQCSETNSCKLSNNGQQVHFLVEQDSKDTQTKKTETVDQQVEAKDVPVPSSAESRLLERIEALERSILSQNLSQSQLSQSNQCQLHQPKVDVPVTLTKSVITTAHMGINCDGCQKKNFVGKRFKCLVCIDFDLCETCESENTHQHPMVRCSAQADTLLLEKMRRKYNKFTTRGIRGGCRQENVGRGFMLPGLRDMFTRNKDIVTSMGSFCRPRPTQAPLDKEEKLEMLRFVMPESQNHWDAIMAKWGHLPILEFCALLNTWEEPTN